MGARRRLPLWASNLVFFGLLFLVVVAYFFRQSMQAKKVFLDHVNDQAQLVAEVIKLNARSAVFSKQVTEQILQSFLSNTARFVDYLDSVEPFNQQELAAYTAEANLAGIRIYHGPNSFVSGPLQWDAALALSCSPVPLLEHIAQHHLYVFTWPRPDGSGCVLIGLAASDIEQMQQQLSLAHVTKTLSTLPGITYVNIDIATQHISDKTDTPPVVILQNQDKQVAEFRLNVHNTEIVVGMGIDYLVVTLKRLWRDFAAFSIALCLLGGILSFLLYRQQSLHMNQVRSYERKLSRGREDAALGRAAASIAHEIRNPLNAIKMGLQRLQIEGHEITPDNRRVVDLLLDEVRRTNSIVSGLLTYTRPQTLKISRVRLDLLVKDALELYKNQCSRLNIRVTQHIRDHELVPGDPDLLNQVVGNLIKNAVEAQPGGGFMHVDVGRRGSETCVRIQNGGFALQPHEAERVFEPYYTTKTEGTGLGLSIARRIIQAHNGHFEIQVKQEGIADIAFYLPVHRETEKQPS